MRQHETAQTTQPTQPTQPARDQHESPAPARPGDASSAPCARFQCAIEFIGRRWNGAIVYVLLDGPCRFNELLAKVPNLSDRLLAERLRELEAAGMVTREVHPGPPVRVVYELTDAGHALSDVIQGISQWAERWLPASAQ